MTDETKDEPIKLSYLFDVVKLKSMSSYKIILKDKCNEIAKRFFKKIKT
jgi:hypothetical protein